jgi:hypothetical protein
MLPPKRFRTTKTHNGHQLGTEVAALHYSTPAGRSAIIRMEIALAAEGFRGDT